MAKVKRQKKGFSPAKVEVADKHQSTKKLLERPVNYTSYSDPVLPSIMINDLSIYEEKVEEIPSSKPAPILVNSKPNLPEISTNTFNEWRLVEKFLVTYFALTGLTLLVNQ